MISLYLQILSEHPGGTPQNCGIRDVLYQGLWRMESGTLGARVRVITGSYYLLFSTYRRVAIETRSRWNQGATFLLLSTGGCLLFCQSEWLAALDTGDRPVRLQLRSGWIWLKVQMRMTSYSFAIWCGLVVSGQSLDSDVVILPGWFHCTFNTFNLLSHSGPYSGAS